MPRDLKQRRLAAKKRREAKRAAQQQRKGQAVQPESMQVAHNPMLQKQKRDARVKVFQAGMKKLAQKHGATSVLTVSQFSFNTSLSNEDGVCNGLSITYLHSFHLGQPEVFFKNINFFKARDANKKPKQRDTHDDYKTKINDAHLQQYNALCRTHEDGETNTHKEMAFRGMSFKKKTFGGGLGHGHTNLGSFVGQKNRYSLISIPGHKMAAYSNGMVYRFYDPNAGEVAFNSASSLGKFLSDYLKLYCRSGEKVCAVAYRYSA